MRLSRGVTGWAFLLELAGVRYAGLAVGLAGINPFTTGDGAGGSLFARAYAWGFQPAPSLEELPFDRPVDHRWCVVRDAGGSLSVRGPDGAYLVHDLDLAGPPGWQEQADASGSVMLVVSHVLPAVDDLHGALLFEMRNGMVCAGSVRFGEPLPPADGVPTATFVINPVGTTLELAQCVCDRILSLQEAKGRARDMETFRKELAEYGAMSDEEMLDTLFRDEFLDHRGMVELMYAYWRLVTEIADACAREAPRRTAALHTVEAAVDLLADRGGQELYEDADALLSGLIDEASDPVELESLLLTAVRLRMATRGPLDLAADHYDRAVLTVWSARLSADLYRTWFTEKEPFQRESHRLVVEAGQLAVRALELDAGARSARLWASLAQVLADQDGVHQGAARSALSAWHDSPTTGEPDLALFLLRVVHDVPPATVDGVLNGVFGTPLPEFVATHGKAVTAKVISQGVNLARERTDRALLRTVLDWAEQLDVRQDSAHRRQLMEARLHVLPDDPTDCTAADGTGAAAAPVLPDSWTPAQRSAALLHASAHARDLGRPAVGITLLKQAAPSRSTEVQLLTSDLYHQSALSGDPVSSPVTFPWGYYMYAALGYAGLGFEQLAQASLVPFVTRMAALSGTELKGALYTIIVDAPNIDTSGAPELGGVLRDLVHSAVWQLTVHSQTQPMQLMLGLHQAGKGAEWGAWWRIDGPLVLPQYVQHFIGKLRDLESPAALNGASLNLLNVLDGDRRPDGQDETQIARNLRWRISSFVDDELRRRSTTLLEDPHLWAKAHELLDDRTVLLTWFLPTAVNGAAVLLVLTRQSRDVIVHLGDGADENADRHPVADAVEAIRTEIERAPLFGDVTPEGRRLLGGTDLPLGGELWDKWRARGKDRVLLWPHGALHYLPVALCSVAGRLIADDWTVTTIAGLESLAPVEVPARQGRTAVLTSAAGGVPFGLHAEPALEEHGRRVADAVGAEAITGPAATRARLLAELSTADVVHIAVHGTLDRDAPWLHCLYLTPAQDDDGRVLAYDFLELDLRGVRLVTLAACESGLGRFDRGDNIRGIPAALITAGVQAVVGSLWPVRPEPATYFHHHMHLRIAQGADTEHAFREAQLATRAEYSHYRDWGSFTYLHGRSKGASP
ncbi:CHAT domain-containing protein [Streptomyces sp. NPDC005963]|uniref:CHAT domain-containing protein n=1 Tax=Streptomyces sp. NPDC005963 TaxID=3156721 RepID=UPI0033CFA8F8